MLQTPLLEDILEIYTKIPDDLTLWKTKNLQLSHENILENIFVLSTNIASFFNIRHNNLTRSIYKLQNEGQLPKRLLNFEQPYESGNRTRLTHTVYALTRHQTYHLIMDFSGPKARSKKHAIVARL
ncbi:hypothetical protein TI05_13215 [Achromatium sp. WMS3]|nr:hypothetical protein TI05_13215 [Achromatium sp. WMS3]